jgi:hypothetical protein
MEVTVANGKILTEKCETRRKLASDTLPNEPGGADSSCRESERRFSSNGRARLGRRLLRNGRLNAARAASPFVVPLGAIAAGNAQVTASSNVSSHVPSAFTLISLPPIFGEREPPADIPELHPLDVLKWIFGSWAVLKCKRDQPE